MSTFKKKEYKFLTCKKLYLLILNKKCALVKSYPERVSIYIQSCIRVLCVQQQATQVNGARGDEAGQFYSPAVTATAYQRCRPCSKNTCTQFQLPACVQILCREPGDLVANFRVLDNGQVNNPATHTRRRPWMRKCVLLHQNKYDEKRWGQSQQLIHLFVVTKPKTRIHIGKFNKAGICLFP